MNRKLSNAIVLVLGLVGCQSGTDVTAPLAPTSTPNADSVGANYRVKRVADGDNIAVEAFQKLPLNSAPRSLTITLTLHVLGT